MSTSIFYYYKFYLKSEKQLKNNQNIIKKRTNLRCVKSFGAIDKLIGSMDKRQNCGVSVANYGNCFCLFLRCALLSIFFGKLLSFFWNYSGLFCSFTA